MLHLCYKMADYAIINELGLASVSNTETRPEGETKGGVSELEKHGGRSCCHSG